MSAITIYSKPPEQCFGCKKSKEVLDGYGVEYMDIDVTVDSGALSFVKDELGFLQVPVILLSGITVKDRDGQAINKWSGLRPDLLKQLANA